MSQQDDAIFRAYFQAATEGVAMCSLSPDEGQVRCERDVPGTMLSLWEIGEKVFCGPLVSEDPEERVGACFIYGADGE